MLVLRMEDLDHPKVKPGAAEEALDDLRWLGLDWDEGPDIGGPHGPYVQSERIETYRVVLEQLAADGRVYPCICTRRDVEAAQSAPHKEDRSPGYPGTCRGRFPNFQAACEARTDGQLPAWRFLVDRAETEFLDRFHGRQQVIQQGPADDFVLARHPDGAGYMLAVVIDDAAMEITEVLRGDDLLDTTPAQLLLQEALGLPRPDYLHVPLVVGPDGKRLAKRHGDTRIRTLRESGTQPEEVVGWLASTCGWARAGERRQATDLLESYDLKTISKNPVVLDATPWA